MIGAMIALAGLSVWAVLATWVVVARDGYRAAPIDWSRPGVSR